MALRVLGFNGNNRRSFEVMVMMMRRTLWRSWCGRGGCRIGECGFLGGTCDGIVEEILQSTEEFQLFDVDWTDGRRGEAGAG